MGIVKWYGINCVKHYFACELHYDTTVHVLCCKTLVSINDVIGDQYVRHTDQKIFPTKKKISTHNNLRRHHPSRQKFTIRQGPTWNISWAFTSLSSTTSKYGITITTRSIISFVGSIVESTVLEQSNAEYVRIPISCNILYSIIISN
jgi:hypothetical protein